MPVTPGGYSLWLDFQEPVIICYIGAFWLIGLSVNAVPQVSSLQVFSTS